MRNLTDEESLEVVGGVNLVTPGTVASISDQAIGGVERALNIAPDSVPIFFEHT